MAATAQTLAVALIVAACAVYALWTLMPSAARRHMAAAMLRAPLPARLAGPLQRTAAGRGNGCACDGCDAAAPKSAAGAAQRMTFHRRPRR
jgi:hypothetical protein